MKTRIDNATQERIPRKHVMARMSELLSRVEAEAATARVTFSDVNGPKGGADIRCGVLVAIPGRPPIRVERVQTTPRLAFDESWERATRELGQVSRRRRDAERRPKKYFVAKRLLTTLVTAAAVLAIPLHVFGQATPPAGDLELKAKKKTTVVVPKPSGGQAAKDAESVKATTEQRRRVDEAVTSKPAPRPNGDVTGGIQSKGIKSELGK